MKEQTASHGSSSESRLLVKSTDSYKQLPLERARPSRQHAFCRTGEGYDLARPACHLLNNSQLTVLCTDSGAVQLKRLQLHIWVRSDVTPPKSFLLLWSIGLPHPQIAIQKLRRLEQALEEPAKESIGAVLDPCLLARFSVGKEEHYRLKLAFGLDPRNTGRQRFPGKKSLLRLAHIVLRTE